MGVGVKVVADGGYIGQQLIFFLRIILAMLCGGIIGIERQQRIKVAGTRTHMMISMAAALMMIISKYGFLDVISTAGVSWDVSRIAASIITGIGILGGIIITGKQGHVSGTTTAAGLMATIAIGMAFGSGMYILGFAVTMLVLGMQYLLHRNLWIVKQTIRAQVVPRTMESSIMMTRLPRTVSLTALSLMCTELSRCFWVDWMKVRPIYRFLMKPTP